MNKKTRDRIAVRVGEVALEHLAQNTRPHSKSLAGSYEVSYRRSKKAILVTTPFFWAAILDGGRGPSVVERGKLMVWFRDPLRDDPRLQGGYGKSPKERRELSREEFRHWQRVNKQYEPGKGPMIVARAVKGVNPTNFTKKRLNSLRLKILRIVTEEMTREIDRIAFKYGLDQGKENIRIKI